MKTSAQRTLQGDEDEGGLQIRSGRTMAITGRSDCEHRSRAEGARFTSPTRQRGKGADEHPRRAGASKVHGSGDARASLAGASGLLFALTQEAVLPDVNSTPRK